MEDILEKLGEIRQKNIPAALLTVVEAKGSTPRQAGAKMIVLQTGLIGTIGGGSVEQQAIADARRVIAEGIARKFRYILQERKTVEKSDSRETGMLCGGEMEVFIEPLISSPTLHLFGACHVGRPTSLIASICGFKVKVYDPRSELANRERMPEVTEFIVENYEKSAMDFFGDDKGFAVVMTPEHGADYEVLKNLIRKSLKYIGVISSKRKKKILFEKLEAEGFSREEISQIHAPIGLDINSETPEEIAVSIVAEMIKARNS